MTIAIYCPEPTENRLVLELKEISSEAKVLFLFFGLKKTKLIEDQKEIADSLALPIGQYFKAWRELNDVGLVAFYKFNDIDWMIVASDKQSIEDIWEKKENDLRSPKRGRKSRQRHITGK